MTTQNNGNRNKNSPRPLYPVIDTDPNSICSSPHFPTCESR